MSVAGYVTLSTPYFGLQKINWFYENKPNERFLVYCWDFSKNDFTLSWAYDIKKIKIEKTIRVKLDDGSSFVTNPDHKVLLRTNEWNEIKNLDFGDHLLAFNKLKPNIHFNASLKTKQFPRIYTHTHGWKNERQFIDEWRTNTIKDEDKKQYFINKIVSENLPIKELCRILEMDVITLKSKIKRAGYSIKELNQLGKETDYRRIIGVEAWKEVDVYTLSVEKHMNFCVESVVLISN